MKLDKWNIAKGLGFRDWQSSSSSVSGDLIRLLLTDLSPEKLILEIAQLFTDGRSGEGFYKEFVKVAHLVIANGDEEATLAIINRLVEPYLALHDRDYEGINGLAVITGLFKGVNSIDKTGSFFVDKEDKMQSTVNALFLSSITEILKKQVVYGLTSISTSSQNLREICPNHLKSGEEYFNELYGLARKYAEGTNERRWDRFEEIRKVINDLSAYSWKLIPRGSLNCGQEFRSMSWGYAGSTIIKGFIAGAFGSLSTPSILKLTWPDCPEFLEGSK